MNSMDLVRYVSSGQRTQPPAARAVTPVSYRELAAPVRTAILRARQYLYSEQRLDGSWLGHTAGDASSTSQLLLLLAYRGEENSELADLTAETILAAQLRDGGWARAPQAPPDVSLSVQAYLALKLAGHDPTNPALEKARSQIRRLGGADAADATTRFFLALFHQVDYECCPPVAPELLLVRPNDQRAIAPLSIVWSHRPIRRVGIERGVRELFLERPDRWADATTNFQLPAAWSTTAAAVVRRLERCGWTPFRRRALRLAESILVQHIDSADSLPLDFSDLVWWMIALETLGHRAGQQTFDTCNHLLRERIAHDDTGQVRPQIRLNPLADTALVSRAMHSSGAAAEQIIGTGTTTWLARPTRPQKSWSSTSVAWLINSLDAAAHVVPATDAASDSLPPDIQVGSDQFTPIARVGFAALQRRAGRVSQELARDLITRQNSDGGWSTSIGIRAPSDPATTGAILEAIATCAADEMTPAIERAIHYLRRTQRADGSWSTSCDGDFIHSTAAAVCGLIAAGIPTTDEAVAAGANWLGVHQHANGGWGEPATRPVDQPGNDYVAGRRTATQTAWALLALLAAGLAGDEPARRAVQFLLDSQDDDGRWCEPHFAEHDPATGAWCRNELHSVAWPLLAVSRWAVAAAAADNFTVDRFQFQLIGAGND